MTLTSNPDVVARPVAGTDPDRLPPRLGRVLRDVHAAETVAVGAERRAAWRMTRELLGGAIAAGYSARLLADCLAVGLDSIRTRAQRDAWLAGVALIGFGGTEAGDLARWRAAGLLAEERIQADGSACYRAIDLVRALADDPDPAAGSPAGG